MLLFLVRLQWLWKIRGFAKVFMSFDLRSVRFTISTNTTWGDYINERDVKKKQRCALVIHNSIHYWPNNLPELQWSQSKNAPQQSQENQVLRRRDITHHLDDQPPTPLPPSLLLPNCCKLHCDSWTRFFMEVGRTSQPYFSVIRCPMSHK